MTATQRVNTPKPFFQLRRLESYELYSRISLNFLSLFYDCLPFKIYVPRIYIIGFNRFLCYDLYLLEYICLNQSDAEGYRRRPITITK